MRIVFPEEIDRLVDIIAPYMIYDHDKGEMVLRADAPATVREAKEKYHKWVMENCYHK